MARSLEGELFNPPITEDIKYGQQMVSLLSMESSVQLSVSGFFGSCSRGYLTTQATQISTFPTWKPCRSLYSDHGRFLAIVDKSIKGTPRKTPDTWD
jgi:hypothetical protein